MSNGDININIEHAEYLNAWNQPKVRTKVTGEFEFFINIDKLGDFTEEYRLFAEKYKKKQNDNKNVEVEADE